METQQQKYHGNNIDNNEITIDYEKREVKFKPIEKLPISFFYLNVTMIMVFIDYVIVGIVVTILGINERATTTLTCSIIFIIIATIIQNYLLLKNKKWRRERFPIINAGLLCMAERKVEFKGKQWSKRIKIPFRNVQLKYIATGDYNRIRRVKIIGEKYRTTKRMKVMWYAVFEFEKELRKGFMEVRYI